MPVICPRHGQEVEIVHSHTGPQELEPGVVVVRTTFTLPCGDMVTLPSGRQIFDQCIYTPQELAEGANERATRDTSKALKGGK